MRILEVDSCLTWKGAPPGVTVDEMSLALTLGSLTFRMKYSIMAIICGERIFLRIHVRNGKGSCREVDWRYMWSLMDRGSHASA